MSSDRMNFSSCFANKIVDGPRLPFATLTTSQSAPKVYASKFISTYQIWLHPDCYCCRDKVNRVASRRAGALFFARYLDYFIVTQNSHLSPGLVIVKKIYCDPKSSAVCRDWQKTRHPDADANSIKPPGR